MSIKIQPNGDRIAVKRVTESEETKTSSGLILPSTSKDSPEEGIVVAVGTGYRNNDNTITPLTTKVGDKVLFPKWAATSVKVDQEELLFIKESEILGTITN